MELENMGVEVLGSTVGQIKDVAERDVKIKATPGQEHHELIQFGMLDGSKVVNGESVENHLTAVGVPKDAVDEWTATQFHSFYFVRYRSFEDPKIKAKIDQAEKDLQKKNQARFQITEALKAKRAERAQVISQLRPLTDEDKRYRAVVDGKRKEMEPLHAALGKLRTANNAMREKGVGLCASEEELDELIHGLHYRIQHESNTLAEEKKFLKEIKQLEGTRDRVAANAALRAKIEDSIGEKEAIQDQVKLIGVDLDGVRKDQQALKSKIKLLEEEKKSLDDDIAALTLELDSISEKRNKAYEVLTVLRNARDEKNALYYQNRSLLNTAKDLAAKKDIQGLQGLCHTQVENFTSQWSTNKIFREDYELRVLPSLDGRQLSRDGRMRNPNEKPIFAEAPPPAFEAGRTIKDGGKNEETGSQKPQLQEPSKSVKTPVLMKNVPETVEESEYFVVEPKKEAHEVMEVDAAKLKEMKREEEIAKNKLAIERKKKQAEKAAAKAEARIQKEAERKQKEKGKRAKKKAGVPQTVVPEQANQDSVQPTDNVDPEVEVKAETSSVVEKVTGLKAKKVAAPRNLLPVQWQPRRITSKRKKSQGYWLWSVPVAAGALFLSALVYYISMRG